MAKGATTTTTTTTTTRVPRFPAFLFGSQACSFAAIPSHRRLRSFCSPRRLVPLSLTASHHSHHPSSSPRACSRPSPQQPTLKPYSAPRDSRHCTAPHATSCPQAPCQRRVAPGKRWPEAPNRRAALRRPVLPLLWARNGRGPIASQDKSNRASNGSGAVRFGFLHDVFPLQAAHAKGLT